MGFVQENHDAGPVTTIFIFESVPALPLTPSSFRRVLPFPELRVPVDQALARARSLGRPIFAIVSWGSFGDQSC